MHWHARRVAGYRGKVKQLGEIAGRHAQSEDPTAREMGRIAAYIVSQWADPSDAPDRLSRSQEPAKR